jgi:hypothetical protein
LKIKFYIDKDKKLIVQRFYGKVSFCQIQECSPHIWEHPDYNPAFNNIVDLRQCDMLFSKPEFKAMIDQLNSDDRALTAKVALMVSEPHEAAMAVMFCDKVEGLEDAGVFVADSELKKFLGEDGSVFKLLEKSGAVEIEIC